MDKVDSSSMQPSETRGFIKNFIYCMQNIANFSGRASRKEFWQFVPLIFVLLIAFLDNVRLGRTLEDIIYLTGLLCILSVSIRRLHDIGKSQFWVLPWFFGWVGVLSEVQTFFSVIFSALPEQWGTFAAGAWSIVFIYAFYLLCKKGTAQ